MNSRQKSLYDYLLDRARTTNAYIPKEVISRDLKELYPRHEETTSEHNSTAYNHIRHDVAVINQSDVGMIIATNKKGYKIGNESQTNRYLRKYKSKHVKGMMRYWKMLKKAQENG